MCVLSFTRKFKNKIEKKKNKTKKKKEKQKQKRAFFILKYAFSYLAFEEIYQYIRLSTI